MDAVMDAMTSSKLKSTLRLEKKRETTTEKDWEKMNRMAYSSGMDTKYQVSCVHETSARQLWEILEKKYLTKSIESRLQLKRRLYYFQMKRGLSIEEHMNSYTKLLADLVNVDVNIDDGGDSIEFSS